MVEQQGKPPVLTAKETLGNEHLLDLVVHLNRLLHPALVDPANLNDGALPYISTVGLKNSVPEVILNYLEDNEGQQVRWDIYMRRLYDILPGDEKMGNALRRALYPNPEVKQLPMLLSDLIRKGNENGEAPYILPLTPENLFYLYNNARQEYKDKKEAEAVAVGILGTLHLEGDIGPDFSATRAERLAENC